MASLDLAADDFHLRVVERPATPAGRQHADVGVGNLGDHVLRRAAIEQGQIIGDRPPALIVRLRKPFSERR